MLHRSVFATISSVTSILFAGLFICASAGAHDYRLADLRVGHPSARPTVPGQASGATYLILENNGKEADKLIGVGTLLAKSAQIHTMSTENDVMKMREVASIELAPGIKITMKPGDGYHIMLLGLQQPLKAGEKFPMTLTFEKAGKLEVSVLVEDKSATGKPIEKDAVDHSKH